jgi:hypothetical protein
MYGAAQFTIIVAIIVLAIFARLCAAMALVDTMNERIVGVIVTPK